MERKELILSERDNPGRQHLSNDGDWIRTHCGRMDHGGCGLLLRVKNGQIVQVKGDKDHPRSKGYLCLKGLASAKRLDHPGRLRSPLLRMGARGEGRWKNISWDEALHLAAEQFNTIKSTYGARAVAFCQGAPKGVEFNLLFRLANTFGSPNVVGVSNVCHVPRELVAQMTMGFFPVVDYTHRARCYLIWGSHLPTTNEEGLLKPFLMEKIRLGAPLIVVDPCKTLLARKASLWLQLRPGSDTALALGFLNVIISERLYDEDFVRDWTVGFAKLREAVISYTPERVAELTWIKADLVREAARLYAQSRPSALQWGNAIEHTIQTFDVCRALSCLMAITGNLDVPGGNLQPDPHPLLSPRQLGRLDLLPSREQERISGTHPIASVFPGVPPPFFTEAVLSGKPYPVRAAYVQGSNPVMAWAASKETLEALKCLDFLCVSEVFMTPTSALADLVLPVATHFEFNDIGHYRLPHGYVLALPKVVDPPPLCWPDMKILNELAKTLGLGKDWWDDVEQMLGTILSPSQLTYAQFAEKGILQSPTNFYKYRTRGFPTPSGKVELSLTVAGKYGLPSVPVFDGFPEPEDPEFPLLLTSAKSPYYFHSACRQLADLRKKSPLPMVTVHPETAINLSIQTGESAWVETRYGRIILTVKVSDTVHPKVVYSEHGWYFPEEPETTLFDCMRSNYNAATSNERLGQAFGTPNLRALPCRLSGM